MMVSVRRALVSVHDKTGLVDFCRRLVSHGVEIVSSGGTSTALTNAGIPVTSVAEVTGSGEILGGRVKTLHPGIHGGILADPNRSDHLDDLANSGIETFQLVVSNLYPFEETVAIAGIEPADVIEQIDIGGPALTRAAAKNHANVGIVTSPDQYEEVIEAIEAEGLDDDFRLRLAETAFFRTARYDSAIVAWLNRDQTVPIHLILPLQRLETLRYGENPHQSAATFGISGAPAWWETARLVQGKEMSYNNILDADAAWRMVNQFTEPAAVIIKHTNPCGVAFGATSAEAFTAAWQCDPVSAFGSVVAVNTSIDEACARAMIEAGFIEVAVAPDIEDETLLASRKNLRLLLAVPPTRQGLDIRSVDSGFTIQEIDSTTDDAEWEIRSARQPTDAEFEQLRFAWKVVAGTKSNAIVIARDRMAVAIGAGDQSRVGAVERAIGRAGDRAEGAVAASDAFFPFRDSIDVLAQAGITAIVEPGGSVRDDEVIGAADEHDMAVVFTGRRHFRH